MPIPRAALRLSAPRALVALLIAGTACDRTPTAPGAAPLAPAAPALAASAPRLDVAAGPVAYEVYAGGIGGAVGTVDLTTQALTPVPTSLPGPVYGIGASPDGRFVYAAAYASSGISSRTDPGKIDVIRTSDHAVVASIGTNPVPFNVVPSPDGARAYVTERATNTVAVIRTSDYTVERRLAVDDDPSGLAISPDGARLYVANAGAASVWAIRTSDLAVVNTLALHSPGAFNQIGIEGLAVSPDGQWLYVSDEFGGRVQVVRASDLTVVGEIPVGGNPYTIVVSPDGTRAYVALQLSGKVAVIRTSDRTAVASVDVGGFPVALAVSPDGQLVYVGRGRVRDQVTVIRTSDNTVTATIPAPSLGLTLGLAVAVPPPAPEANLSAPTSVLVGDAFSISVENAHTPGRAGGFTYTVALDCGDGAGYGAVGTERERSCPTSAEGTRTVKGKVLDQDGRFTEYTAVVRVVKRPQSITFTPPPPASATLGTSLTLAAAGGGSGNPVVFGTLTPSACSVSGSTVRLLAIGACTVSADQAGDATYLPAVQRTATIAVVWLFTGFLAPVDSAPALNRVNAGSAVPIKFGLGGDRGMSVLPGGSPASMPVSCATGAALGPATPTETPGKSGLTYDAASQTYAIVWRTDKGWAGSCRQLALTLADGSTHTARFEFR